MNRSDEAGKKDFLTGDGLLCGSALETVARAIHEEYVRQAGLRGETAETNSSLVPWELLPDTLKNSNRTHASLIGKKLDHVGCTMSTGSPDDDDAYQMTTEDIEQLAIITHDHWMAERRADGWTYAPGPKNVAKKTSEWFVPFQLLPDEEQEKDRDPVRAIPLLLSKAGLKIIRKA